MRRPAIKYLLIFSIACLASCLGCGSALLFAQSERVEESRATEPIEFGFAGHVRLGFWNPITFHLQELSSQRNELSFEVECEDSNGTRTRYSGRLLNDPEFPEVSQGWFRLGRNQGQLTVRLLDKDGLVVLERANVQVSEAELEAHPSTRQITLVIEKGTGIQEKIKSGFSNSSDLVVGLNSFSSLPNNALMYESLDHVYLSLDDSESLKSLSAMKLAALTEWLQNGGRLIVSGGPGSIGFLDQNELNRVLCPGKVEGSTTIVSSSRLNFFANGSTSLIGSDEAPLTVSKVVPGDAVVLLEQDEVPIVIRAARGFGQLTFVSLDLHDSRFQEWPDSVSFISRLFRSTQNMSSQTQEETGGRVSHYGYEDMTGQLRVPLDQFTNVKFISFTWVAILIGLFILCIGPGDYFLLRKLLGKMELTWITFTLMAIGFCSIAYFGNKFSKPAELQINQLEIIDVNLEHGRVRSSVWSNIFSPRTENVNLKLAEHDSLGFQQSSRQLTWQGLPGKGLGGMQSKTVADFGSETYRSPVELTPGSEFPNVEMQRLPFQVSSSKSMFGQWYGPTPFQLRSRLKYDNVTEQIQGTVTNPLDIELRNCRIYYDNWVYLFDQPFGAGETVDLLSETSEKNIKSFMTRRQAKENKGSNTPWNPTDTDVARIANMLMFFDAAGGASYTNLTHLYQSSTDMTNLLSLNRAILVGETSELVTRVEVSGSSAKSLYDQHTTLIRFVIPIENAKPNRRSKP